MTTELLDYAEDSPWRIQLLTSLDDMRQIEPQWQLLSREAQSPNAFFEPCFLLPALHHLQSKSVSLLCVWASEARDTLLALMPIQQRPTYYQLPLANTTLWRHTYCYLCNPLVSKLLSNRQLLAVFQKLGEKRHIPPCFVFSWLGQQSVLVEPGLNETGGRWRFHRDATLTRAGLRLHGTHADFLASLRTKKRKDLFRSKRRLAETGEYRSAVISGTSDPVLQKVSVSEFLELENQGWKQAQGSSMASDPAHERYFRASVAAGLANHQVLIVRLSLDDQLVAMLVVLLSACGRAGYTQKMAINSQFERYSPGSLVILELTEYVYLSTRRILTLDSCAAQNHPMIDALWRDRQRLSSFVATGRSSWRDSVISLVNVGRSLKKRITTSHYPKTQRKS